MKDYNYVFINITLLSLGLENILSGYNLGGLAFVIISLISQIYKMYKTVNIKTIIISSILILVNLSLMYNYCLEYMNLYLVIAICFASINLSLWYNHLVLSTSQNIVEMNRSITIVFTTMIVFITLVFIFNLNYKAPIFILYISILLTITIQVKFITLLRLLKYYDYKTIN